MDSRLAIRGGRLSADALQQNPRIPCRFHARGACSRGNACQFGHDGPGNSESTSSIAPTSISQPESRPRAFCRYFASGNCLKGDFCPFEHKELPKVSVPVDPPHPNLDSRFQVPCQFFAKGTCRNGDACPFAHVGVPNNKVAGDEQPKGLVFDDVCHYCSCIPIRS